MTLESAGYRGWSDRLRSPWLACWAIARTGLRLVLRFKLFWFLLGLAALNFLFYASLVYFKASLAAENRFIAQFADRLFPYEFGSAAFYRDFVFTQGTVTMILLAFAGSLLIGNDYRYGGLTFHLSRRIGRVHYVAGKLLTIALVVSLTTTIPALALFFQYGFLTELVYLRDNLRIFVGLLAYSVILALVLGLLLFALACWLKRTVPVVMTWAGLVLFLPALGEILSQAYAEPRYRVLNILWDIRILGAWCLGALDAAEDQQLLAWAAATLAAVCVASVAAIVPRMRDVKVVQ